MSNWSRAAHTVRGRSRIPAQTDWFQNPLFTTWFYVASLLLGYFSLHEIIHSFQKNSGTSVLPDGIVGASASEQSKHPPPPHDIGVVGAGDS